MTLCAKRGPPEGSVQTLRHAGRRELSHPLDNKHSTASATASPQLPFSSGSLSHQETSVASLVAVEVVQARQQQQGRYL